MSIFNLSENFKILSDDFQTAMESSMEFYKLDFFGKFMKGAVSMVNLLIIGSAFMIFLLFFSVAIAIVIGDALESLSAGYFIVAGFYFVLFLFMLIFGKPIITKKVLTKYSKVVFNEETQKQVLDDKFKKLVD
ncbi:phage holin family protein [Flavimarina sp. Hel_I_48]|uniref:phage holin family protein n=1 Tax=Flavimarina sp. Hel_I_48 TaxID=1392488 RepID=UPI0013DC9440|nr:phage holin family protein [Flavimarina sp. Hel_I_48]